MFGKKVEANGNGAKLEEFVTWLYKKLDAPNVQHNVVVKTSYDPEGLQIDVLLGKHSEKTLVECKYSGGKIGRDEVSDTLAKATSLYKARKTAPLLSRYGLPKVRNIVMITNSDYVSRAYIYLNDVVKKDVKNLEIKGFYLINGFDLEGMYFKTMHGWKGRELRKLWQKTKKMKDKEHKVYLTALQYAVKHRHTIFKDHYRKKVKAYRHELTQVRQEMHSCEKELNAYKREKHIQNINYIIQHWR